MLACNINTSRGYSSGLIDSIEDSGPGVNWITNWIARLHLKDQSKLICSSANWIFKFIVIVCREEIFNYMYVQMHNQIVAELCKALALVFEHKLLPYETMAMLGESYLLWNLLFHNLAPTESLTHTCAYFRLRDGWRLQNGWIFGTVSKGRSFSTQK